MPVPQHIDDILRDWEYVPSQVCVRTTKGADRREVIQMRVDMGLLQLETTGRPDGSRPGGAQTYLDYLLASKVHAGPAFVMDEQQCLEADREFVQFYHRRICWLHLRRFESAVRDADHTLELMDFCREHSPDEQWTMSHEQYRPFVLFHRTQAAALHVVDGGDGPDRAVSIINDGLERLRAVYAQFDVEEQFDQEEVVERLVELREHLRDRFAIGRTLDEQLRDAVAAEEYETAARIRDELARRKDGRV